MISPWEFLLMLGAVAYGFYLVSEATLTERPRDWILERLDSDKAEAFVVCPWCVGFWLALIVLAWYTVAEGWLGWFWFPVTWLALAAANGLLHRLTDST